MAIDFCFPIFISKSFNAEEGKYFCHLVVFADFTLK